MEDAAIMGLAGLATQFAGSGFQAFGQYEAGTIQDQISQYNASIMFERGRIALDQARARASIQATNTAGNLGAIRASYGASGVDANQGSPLLVQADQAARGELSRQLLLYQGEMENLSDEQQGQLDLAGGQTASRAGTTAAVGTLLTGGAKTIYGGYQLLGGGNPTIPTPASMGISASVPAYNAIVNQ